MATGSQDSGRPWIDALVALGFTQLEAEIYGVLGDGEPATGYRIAQRIGKPAANVYKALESLHGKGAVLVEDTSTRRVRAVPAKELLASLERDFARRRRRAAGALAKLPRPRADRRVYELGSRDQAFERARTMLRSARSIALIDLGPGPLAELADAITAAAARGVHVALRTEHLAGRELPGVEVTVIPERSPAAVEPWPGEWLTLVTDGVEHMLAVFDQAGGLHQAIWSNSAFLSWVFHSGVAAEIALDRVWQTAAHGGTRGDIRAVLDGSTALVPPDAIGRRRLIEELRRAITHGESS